MKIDLHMHTYHSDGTDSTEALVELAKSEKMDYIAITDHNTLGAYNDLDKIDLGNLKIVKGVEIDGYDNGYNVHILAYGFDINNHALIDMVNKTSQLLDDVDRLIICEIQKKYPTISLEEYDEFEYDRKLGGWKGLHYLINIGICNLVDDAFKLYFEYVDCYNRVDFMQAKEIVKIIHQANGIAILAHPGKVYPTSDINEFIETVKKVVINNAFDGIECYYPKHNEEVTNALLDISKDLLRSVGSDYHGLFTSASMHQMNNYPLFNIMFGEIHLFNNKL